MIFLFRFYKKAFKISNIYKLKRRKTRYIKAYTFKKYKFDVYVQNNKTDFIIEIDKQYFKKNNNEVRLVYNNLLSINHLQDCYEPALKINDVYLFNKLKNKFQLSDEAYILFQSYRQFENWVNINKADFVFKSHSIHCKNEPMSKLTTFVFKKYIQDFYKKDGILMTKILYKNNENRDFFYQ